MAGRPGRKAQRAAKGISGPVSSLKEQPKAPFGSEGRAKRPANCRPEDRKPLGPRALRAIDLYVATGVWGSSLRDAGYSKAYAINPSAFYNNPGVKAELERRQAALAVRYEITADKVTQRLAQIGFNPGVGALIEALPDGTFIVDWNKLSPETKACIKTIKSEVTLEGVSEDKVPVRKMHVEVYDALRALELLGKNLGLFTEKVEVTTMESKVTRLMEGRKRAARG